jgi:peptidoglycan LD-endopeptidase LytH
MMKTSLRLGAMAVIVAVLVTGFLLYKRYNFSDTRSRLVLSWLRAPGTHPEWAVQAGQRCQGAPFILPTSGFIGYLWDDSFYRGHHHTGLDIFGGTAPGEIPVVAAYDGYLTRLPDWKSTVIVRIPQDPLQPDRQVWTYYTHLADAHGNSLVSVSFPPGTYDTFVTAGTQLGYQGNYSGNPVKPVGVHLHFSIVRDDGRGQYLNEMEIENTLDPSPYFNLQLNAKIHGENIAVCE